MLISSCEVTTITIDIEDIDLGNNYSYQHFINALAVDPHNVCDICELIQLDADIVINSHGNHGRVKLETNGSDLYDHLKPFYDRIEWDSENYNYYYKDAKNEY